MAQQVGTAVGLAAFTIIAVAYARGSAPAADRLHGLQVAILSTATLALAAAVLAALTLPWHATTGAPGSPRPSRRVRLIGRSRSCARTPQLRGMPSTSSPMTLSCISSVPPPMSVGGTDR